MQRGLAISSFLLLSASLCARPALALQATQEETYRSAYLSHVEGEVSLQRASESEPGPGALNVPFLPGDRVWTSADSRAELRFGSGLVVHLSEGAKLDFVATEPETILRLWSGSAILSVPESSGALRVDSPGGSVRPTREGTYRIDVETDDAVTLSVERGAAELASSLGTVLVESGETSFATPKTAPSVPVGFNTARLDDFDRWSESRMVRGSGPQEVIVRSLPPTVRSYVYDLDPYGYWDHEPDYGYVWYPRVSLGWAPYTYGRWGYTTYGYTWISSEPWGWAPYHYGRWGYGHRGWYWVPGPVWGPAWVSFAFGPFWVGWSPLGYYNRPVFHFNTYYGGYGGYHYGRGHGYHHGGGWNVCSRDDFTRGVVTREGYRRLDPESVSASAETAQFVDDVSSLDRDLNPRSDRRVAVPRSTRRLEESADALAPRARREEALRGFRERALAPSTRVIEDTTRASDRRSGRPSEVEDLVSRARELSSAPEARERATREPRGFSGRRLEDTPEKPRGTRPAESDRSPRSGLRATESDGSSRSGLRATESDGSSRSGLRERFDRVAPLPPSRDTRSTGSSSAARQTREARERDFPRARVPETGTERRPRFESMEPQRGRPRMESPSRENGGGGRSARERSSSSVGSRSSGDRAGDRGSTRSSGGASSSRSKGGGSARPRSN